MNVLFLLQGSTYWTECSSLEILEEEVELWVLTHLETDTRLLPALCKHHLVYGSDPSAVDDEHAPLQVLQAQGYINSSLLIHGPSDKCPERKSCESCVFLNQLNDGLSVLQNNNDSPFLRLGDFHISLCYNEALCVLPFTQFAADFSTNSG